MIKKLLFLIVTTLFTLTIYSQKYFNPADSIEVYQNGNKIPFPFQGGYNAPQFNEIDLNQDGTLDLMVFDRSGSRISTYINNGTPNSVDYTYAPQYQNLFPIISNWAVTRDYNCDGKMDLFTGIRSAAVEVYENTSTTSNGLSFRYAGRVSSDYGGVNININPGGENIPGIGDVNNDGDIDFIFFGGIGAQMEFHKNISVEVNGTCGLLFERRNTCWGKFTEAGFNSTIYLNYCRFGENGNNPELVKDIISELPKKGSNNNKSNKHAGSSVSLIDLDNSGSSDLVLGDIGSNRLTALYNGDSVAPYISSLIDRQDSLFPSYDKSVYLDIFPSSFFLDINNDGKKDMIVSSNSNSLQALTKYKNNIQYYKNLDSNSIDLEYQTDKLFHEDILDFGRGCFPIFFDHNNDGLKDLLIGNDGYLDTSLSLVVGHLALLENTGTSSKPKFTLVDTNYMDIPSIPLDLSNNHAQKGLRPAVGDLDGDGDDDLLIGDIAGKVHYFKDTSSASNNAAFELEKAAFQEINVFGNASPFLYDINYDSLLDLIVGSNNGRIAYHENLGNPTEPIFNLDIQSITWLRDSISGIDTNSIKRYVINGNPRYSYFSIGQTVDIKNAINGDNNATQTILRIDSSNNYMDLISTFKGSSLDDESNSPAVLDYSIKNWGNTTIIQFGYNQNATPFLYKDTNSKLQLIIGSNTGQIFQFDSIDNNINGNFRVISQNLIGSLSGFNTFIGGSDINNDGKIDLSIGNEAGGFSIYYGSFVTGIEEIGNSFESRKQKLIIYPNPTNNRFTIEIPSETQNSFTCSITDIGGREIKRIQSSGRILNVNTDNLSQGVYIVTLYSENKIYSEKLIVRP